MHTALNLKACVIDLPLMGHIKKSKELNGRASVDRTLLSVCINHLDISIAALKSAKRYNMRINFTTIVGQG